MQRVTRASAVTVQPARPASPGPAGFFTGGNPGGGVPATVPGYEWFNDVQEELVNAILRSGIALSGGDQQQLIKALDRLFGGGLRTLTANATLTADDAGLLLVDASAGNRTHTLPVAASVGGRPIHLTFVRTDTSANSVTIQRAGADTIEGLTTISLPPGGRLVLVSDGSAAWRLLRQPVASGMQVFTASGTFNVPSGVYLIDVEVLGGGGGGGGSGTANTGGAGGGGGGYARRLCAVTPGQAVSVTVGAGGAGSTSNGATGGTSSFGAFCSATGGEGGQSFAAGAAGGGPGVGSGGDLNLAGGFGTDGAVNAAVGGSGGAPAGLGGGGGRAGSGAGIASQSRGGGGGGAYTNIAANVSGGAGGPGIVVVKW